MRRDLRGLRILVTGPARGIGADLARRLRARGARLALVGLEPGLLTALAEELGPDTVAVEADVRDLEALTAAANRAVTGLGGLDVVVANAGVLYGTTATGDDAHREQVTVEVNLLGVMRTVRATLPHILASRGQYVLVSSLAAHVQMPLLGAYSASKAGVHAYGNTLRLELAAHGVTVTMAYFGFVDTHVGRLARDSRSTSRLTQAVPGPLSRLYQPRVASDAILRAIERRSRRAVAPSTSVTLAHMLPALHQRLGELVGSRRVPEALRIAALEPELREGSTGGLR